MERGIKNGLIILSIVSFIVIWTLLMKTLPPEKIINIIGIKNGYLIVFLVALLGGLTSFTGVSYYLIIITLTSGGLNPILLGIIGGTGGLISDGVFFFLGSKFGESITNDKRSKINKISKWLHEKPKWVVPVIVFFYLGLTPLPNDLITLSLGTLKYKFKQIAIPIWFGNIVSTIIFAYLGASLLNIFI